MAAPIVIAVDLSQASRKALVAGRTLAKDLDAPVVLVHALPQGSDDPVGELRQEMAAHEAVELSTKWAGDLREAGLETTTVAEEADPVDLVLATARRHRAALVVAGSHGATGLRRAVLGSTAEGLVRGSTVPVVVVPWRGRRRKRRVRRLLRRLF